MSTALQEPNFSFEQQARRLRRCLSAPIGKYSSPAESPSLKLLTLKMGHLHITSENTEKKGRPRRLSERDVLPLCFKSPLDFKRVPHPIEEQSEKDDLSTQDVSNTSHPVTDSSMDLVDFDIRLFLEDGFFCESGVKILSGLIRKVGVGTVRLISKTFYHAVEKLSEHCIFNLTQKRNEAVKILFFRESLSHVLESCNKEKAFRKCQIIVAKLQDIFTILDIPFTLDDFFSNGGDLRAFYQVAQEKVVAFNAYASHIIQIHVPQYLLDLNGINLNALSNTNPFQVALILERFMKKRHVLSYLTGRFRYDIQGLQLRHIPLPFYRHAQSARLVNLNNNRLRYLPADLQVLTRMAFLYVSNNDLRSVSSAILKHPTLKFLDVSHNPNLVFDQEVSLSPNLDCINAHGITFSKIPTSILRKLLYCETFDFFYDEDNLSEYALCQIASIVILRFLQKPNQFFLKFPKIRAFYDTYSSLLNLEFLETENKPIRFCREFFLALESETKSYSLGLSYKRLIRSARLHLSFNQKSIEEKNAQGLRDFLHALSDQKPRLNHILNFHHLDSESSQNLVEWNQTLFSKYPEIISILQDVEIICLDKIDNYQLPIEILTHCHNLKVIILGEKSFCSVPSWVNQRQRWTILQKEKKGKFSSYEYICDIDKEFLETSVHHTTEDIQRLLPQIKKN